MIIEKLVDNLSWKEHIEINNFILNNFDNSRLDTYDKVIIYKENDYLIGFLGISNNYLNQLCVKKEYRCKGIATTLLKYARKILIGIIYLFIDKNKLNTDYLVNFYKKNGFIIEYENNEEYKMFKY